MNEFGDGDVSFDAGIDASTETFDTADSTESFFEADAACEVPDSFEEDSDYSDAMPLEDGDTVVIHEDIEEIGGDGGGDGSDNLEIAEDVHSEGVVKDNENLLIDSDVVKTQQEYPDIEEDSDGLEESQFELSITEDYSEAGLSSFEAYDYETAQEKQDETFFEKNGEFVSAGNPYKERWEEYANDLDESGEVTPPDWDSLSEVPFNEMKSDEMLDGVSGDNSVGAMENSVVGDDFSSDPLVGSDGYQADLNISPEENEVIEGEELQEESAIGESIEKIADAEDVDRWLSDVNPNYDPWDVDSPYNSNCGSCALAVEKRLDGDDSAIATDSTLTIEEMEQQTGMEQVSMQPNEIEQYLTAQGPGAHAIIGIDRSTGPGHWFNAYYDGEKVYALDGQSGEKSEWPPDYGDVVNWDVSIRKDDSR